MVTFLSIVISVISILLMLTVLLQNSKGGGLSGSFGSLGSTQMFGVRRATDVLSNTTTTLAALLFMLCIIMEFIVISKKNEESGESILQKNAVEQPASSPEGIQQNESSGEPALPIPESIRDDK